MCNLYNITTTVEAMRAFVKGLRIDVGNLPPSKDYYQDYLAPIARIGADGAMEVVRLRWGMPTPLNVLKESAEKRAEKLRAKGQTVDFADLLAREPDSGVTNIRNTNSPHWRRWLGPAHRCLVLGDKLRGTRSRQQNGRRRTDAQRLVRAEREQATLRLRRHVDAVARVQEGERGKGSSRRRAAPRA